MTTIGWVSPISGFGPEEVARRDRIIRSYLPAGFTVEFIDSPAAPPWLDAHADFRDAIRAGREFFASIDPQLPIGLVRTMDDMIGESIAPRRLNFVLVSAFAVVALVLTAAGLYGVMAYVVVQRTREIGVRVALGATRGQVLALMFRQAGTLTAIGIALGVAGALVLTRWMSSLLFGVSAANPLVYVAVSALLAAVAALAVAVPSSRATRVDPLHALRQ